MGRIISEQFWTADKILLLIVFFIGFILGAFAMDFYNTNISNKFQSNDYNSMLEINQRLSERNDQLFSCLIRNKVEPEEC